MAKKPTVAEDLTSAGNAEDLTSAGNAEDLTSAGNAEDVIAELEVYISETTKLEMQVGAEAAAKAAAMQAAAEAE